jgi:hypothetical protein
MEVTEDANGSWVIDDGRRIAGPFDTNAAAWSWIDRHDGTVTTAPPISQNPN